MPPCTSATFERAPFWEGMKELVNSVQFWWIALITSVSMGMVFSVSVLILEAISPFGYTDQQAGICASAVVFSGCLGGGNFGDCNERSIFIHRLHSNDWLLDGKDTAAFHVNQTTDTYGYFFLRHFYL